jgi:hypothetical protein
MEKLIKNHERILKNQNENKYINEEDSLYNNIIEESYLLNNNNEAFNFIDSFFSYFKLIFTFFYDCCNSCSKSRINFLNNIQIFFYTITCYFGLVLSFESNSNISTNLILSAYFANTNYTSVTYEQILENGKKLNKSRNNSENNILKEYNENMFTFNNILISLFCFFGLFLIIKLTFKARIKNFIFFNIFGIYIFFYLVKSLYKMKNYFSSSFMLILLIYFEKNLFDSIFIKLRYEQRDFEIFSRNLISSNFTQFILKLLSLLNITFFSLYFSLFYYNFWLNYFINYLCIISLLSFIGNCLEQFVPYYLKPIKYILMFFIGVLNIFISKFFLKKILFKENKKNYFYSLYLINDLFSAYCINFINNYIDYQYRCVIEIKIQLNKINNKIDKKHYILGKNIFWICYLFLSISYGYIGIFMEEYFLFILSIFISQKYIYFFRKLYNIKISRILNNIFILNFFTFIPRIKNMNDFILLFLLKSITNLDIQIIIFSLEFIFLLYLLYYIITTNFILYINIDEINQKNNTSRIFNIIYILIEIAIQFLTINFIIRIYKYSEEKLIINVLNLFAIIIYHLLKIPSINELKKKTDENINYNFYIFIWVIISLRLIEVSGPEISLLYLINHINLIFFINFYILNDRNNNIFKIIVIFLLLIDYYRLHSWLFIVDAIAIIIYPIIKNLKRKEKNKNYIYDDRYRINLETIKAYNKLTFSFALFLLLFSLLEIG